MTEDKFQPFEYRCQMFSEGIGVNIYTQIPVFLKLLQRIGKDEASGITVKQGISPHNPISIRYINTQETSIKWEEDSIDVKAPWEIMNEGDNFVYLALPLVERQKQIQGATTVHAASCVLNHQGLLLLGKEGSGKTSIIYKICKDFGGKLIGNDLTTLKRERDSILLTAGSKFFFLREASVRKSMEELSSFLPKTQKDPWLNKVKVNPDEIGITTENSVIPLKRAFYVHIDEYQENPFKTTANTLANRLHLNENFSRYIRGSCTSLLDPSFNYWGYIPSFDTEEFYKTRCQTINLLYNKYGLEYISGKSDAISAFIANSIRNERALERRRTGRE